MGWKKRAISRSRGEKATLSTMTREGEADYWIIPKKLSVDAMQRITQAVDINVELDSEEIKGKTIDEIEQIMAEKIKNTRNKKSLFAEETLSMMEITFLEGVEDHNFDDDNGAKLQWNKELYGQLREFPDTLLEIFRIVMRFNYPLALRKQGS